MENKKIIYVEFFYRYGLYAVFILLIMFFTVSNPQFILPGNLRNILQQSSAAGVAVVGLVFVMLTAGIDISIGSIMYFTVNIVILLINAGIIPDNYFGIALALLAAVIVGGVAGSINGFFTARLNIPPLIVTIATFSAIRGITYTINNIKGLYFNNFIGDIIGRGRIFNIVPIVVVILIIALASGQYVLKYTRFGRQLYAIGNNEAAARKVGIKVDRIKFLVYVIAGATAGISGVLLGSQTTAVVTSFAQDSHFVIISSAVLGGTSLFGGKGSIFPGAFLGVLIVICIENGLIYLGANPYFYTIVRGVVIFLAVMMDCIRNKNELR